MEKIKTFCLRKIGELKQKQKDHGEYSKQFSALDYELKRRKKRGENLTEDTPDVKELMKLGKLIGYNDNIQAETWNTYEAGIEAYESVLKELNKTQ